MRVSWPNKYPGEEVVYSVNWATRFDDVPTISGAAFTVLTGDVTIVDSGFSGLVSWAEIHGGTGTGVVEVLCEIQIQDTNSDGGIRPLQEIAEFRMLAIPA